MLFDSSDVDSTDGVEVAIDGVISCEGHFSGCFSVDVESETEVSDTDADVDLVSGTGTGDSTTGELGVISFGSELDTLTTRLHVLGLGNGPALF